jgi:hypothetical protein
MLRSSSRRWPLSQLRGVVVPIEIGELMKAEVGPSCMSLLF